MKLGEVLAEMILYGDLDEAVWPADFPQVTADNPEAYCRCNIAATLLKLTNAGEGGACSFNDGLVKPLLQQEVGK